MAEEKVVSFKIDITGVSNEAEQLAKIEYQLKNLKKEKQELDKLAAKGFLSSEDKSRMAAYSREIENQTKVQKELKKVMDSAPDSLNRMRAELIKLKDAYGAASAEARTKMAPAIMKLNDEVSKAEQAVGVHQRNVGNYPTVMGRVNDSLKGFANNIKESATNMLSAGGIMAAATVVIAKLGEAFKSTVAGMNAFNVAGQVSKQLFYDLITTGTLSLQNMKDAADAAKLLNEIRAGDRADLVEFAKINGEISKLEFEAADKTKTRTEREIALNAAIQKQNELSTKKILDTKEELDAIDLLLIKRPQDEKLLLKQAELVAKIYDLDRERFDQSKRNQSRLTGFIQEETKEREKMHDAWMDEIDEENEKQAKAAKERKELRDKEEKEIAENHKNITALFKKKWEDLVKEEKVGNSLKADVMRLMGIDPKDMGLQQNKQIAEANKKGAKAASDYDIKLTEDTEKKKLDIKNAAFQGVEMGVAAGFEAKKNRLQGEMEAELSKENLTEKQKKDIQKKYAKEQQSIDIKQAIINGALAIGKTFAQFGFPLGVVPAALVALQTGMQVAAIKSVRYATGGKINKGVHVNTGTVDDTLIVANKTETVLTQRHVAALGGSGVMRRIGVPGYAEGGYIGQQAPVIPAMGPDFNSMVDAIRGIQIRLDINKVNSAQRELEVITETQRI